MDCFFAAVEALDDPSLLGKPVVVGGIGYRGVVSSASYEARGFGVHSAMPTAEARRLCPNAVYLSPRHDRYGEVSEQLGDLLRDVTPLVEPLSLDEAFLDVSGAHRLAGSSEQIAHALVDRVGRELGLRCSVGGGRSKLIAKLASKAAKPRITAEGPELGSGVLIVVPADELSFLHAHPVRALPGIGPRSAERLARLGISGVGELSMLSRERLVALFGKSQGAAILELANGIDERGVEPQRALRSIGHEETFERDLWDLAELEERARRQSASVASRCRRAELFGRTVSVKLRHPDFTTLSRARSFDHRLVSANEIADVAISLLRDLDLSAGVRLLGVSVSNLESGEEARQLALFGDDARAGAGETARHDVLDTVAHSIRERFGATSITAASAVQSPKTTPHPPED
jgi:DNA polymerase-4